MVSGRVAVIFLVLGFLAAPGMGFAYGPRTTHAGLTDEIVDFYNLLHPESVISEKEKEWIVEGSVMEDESPRWANHLYDPVKKIGWDGRNFGRAHPDVVRFFRLLTIPGEILSAYDWVMASDAQKEYSRYGGDRTWPAGIKYFAGGNREEAFRTLGHVLHLLEDMSVPAHTRNDPHPHGLEFTGEGGSPYEDYAQRFTRENLDLANKLKAEGVEPLGAASVQEYLDLVARYSNKYFFSRDTVNDESYSSPKIVRTDSDFGYGVDENGDEFELAKARTRWDESTKDFVTELDLLNKPAYQPILSAYFSRLSRMAVVSGAGLLDLFLKEGKEAWELRDFQPHILGYDPSRISPPKISVIGEGFKLVNGVRGFFASVGHAIAGAAERVRTLALGAFSGEESADVFDLGLEEDRALPDEAGQGSETAGEPTQFDVWCDFDRVGRAAARSLILSEVAWMGDRQSFNNEWLEVVNVSGGAVNLADYRIQDQDGGIKVALGDFGKTLPAGNFLVLRRGQDYTGVLGNSNESVRIFDAGCAVADEAAARPGWPAGENESKKTMERDFADFGWQTSAFPGGTPGKASSAPVKPKAADEDEEDEDKEEEVVAKPGENERKAEADDPNKALQAGKKADSEQDEAASLKTTEEARSCPFQTSALPQMARVVISEVAWMGSVSSSADEWIELKNILPAAVEISGWQLRDKAGQIKFTFSPGEKIAAGGFYLMERTDDDSAPGVAAAAFYAGSIGNTNEGLRLFSAECGLEDQVLAEPDWPAGDNGVKKTMERRDNLTWQTSAFPGGTPGRANSEGTAITSGGGGAAAVSRTPAVSGAPAVSTSTAGALLVSEVLPRSADEADYEFIELYNPGNQPVVMQGWKVRKRTASGNEYNLVSELNGTAPALGFFLIASQEYDGAKAADAVYSQTSNHLAGSDNTVVILDGSGTAVDEAAYGEVNAGESLERRALSSGACVSAQGAGALLGNGCDTGSAADFETRSAPEPQNTADLTEPREEAAPGPAAGEAAPQKLFMSEVVYDASGSDAGKEFVELYNSWDEAKDLNGWRLEYLLGNATTADTLAVIGSRAEDVTTAPARGFFLIGLNNYASGEYGGVAADVVRAAALPNGSVEAAVFLYDAEGALKDSFTYSSTTLAEGESVEFRAYAAGGCVSAQGAGEYLGNGCDETGSAVFEARSVPKPQNSGSLPEPRVKPVIPAPLASSSAIASYRSGALAIDFAWAPSADASGATSSVYYAIRQTAPTSSLVYQATSTEFSFSGFREVGLDYDFTIEAFDAEGLGSGENPLSVAVPSFFRDVAFYEDPRGDDDAGLGYLIEFYYDDYPFVPDIYNDFSDSTWKNVVVYLNAEPEEDEYIYNSNPTLWAPLDTSKLLSMSYKKCATGSEAPAVTILLPDSGARCDEVGGGLYPLSLNFPQLEDLHFWVRPGGGDFSEDDYLTFGFYSYISGGVGQNFRKVALDRTHWFFRDTEPAHEAPQAPENFTFSFDTAYSKLSVNWDKAKDKDTVDDDLEYEYNYTTSTEFDEGGWKPANFPQASEFSVEFGNEYLVGARATDDFGATSTVGSAVWNFPEGYVPLPAQLNHSGLVSGKIDGVSRIGQLVTPAEDITVESVKFWIYNSGQYCCVDSFLNIYADDGGDFGALIASSMDKRTNRNQLEQEVSYVFPTPVDLSGGTGYWLSPEKGPDFLNDGQVYGAGGNPYPGGSWSEDSDQDAYFVIKVSGG